MFRIGIARQRQSLQRWQHDCIQAVLAGGFARIALVLEVDYPPPLRLPFATRAGAEVTAGATVDEAETMALSSPPTQAERDRIAGFTLDLVLDLTGLRLGPTLPHAARHGVWSFHFGDLAQDDGTAPGLAAVAEGALATGAALYRQHDGNTIEVLREGWFRTRQTPRRNADSLLLRSARWPALVVNQMADTRAPPQVVRRAVLPAAARPDILARHLAAAGRFAAYAGASLRRRLCRERWSIGIADQPIAAVIRERRLAPVRWIEGQPDDRFYADPFPLRQDGEALEILVESAPFATAVGHLALLRLSPALRLEREEPVLETPHHLSYPFVLRLEEGVFVVPESWEANRLSAHRFGPDGRLARDSDLVTGRAIVDGTLVRHERRWWLFCCDRRDDDTTNLHLFHAEHWHGPWLPHAMNPVKTDVRSSRPAGAMVAVEGQLWRPAQDCALRYGNAIAMNRVVELDERRFREETAFVLRPDPQGPYPDGLHTISGIGDVTVVDGQRLSFEPWNALADRRARRQARKRRDQ